MESKFIEWSAKAFSNYAVDYVEAGEAKIGRKVTAFTGSN
jgi:hypothetical protein